MTEDFSTPAPTSPSLSLPPSEASDTPACWQALVALVDLCVPLERQLFRFQLEDRPHFRSWFAAEFSQSVTRFRLAKREECAFQRNLSRLADGVLGTSFCPNAGEDPRENPNQWMEDLLDRLRQPVPGENESDEEKTEEPTEAPDPIRGIEQDLQQIRMSILPFPRTAPPDPDRLRKVYRWLARALHPDTRRGENLAEDTLWLEVQDAHRNHNLCRLETLWAIVQAKQGGGPQDTDPDGVFLAALEMENRVRQLAAQVRNITASPAYAFHHVQHDSALPPLRNLIYRRMRHVLREQENELQLLRRQFSKASRRLGASPNRPPKKEQLVFF